ncbi:MAG: hypothetical protein JXB26_13240 [Candidatus Aminicenantes bacterium]|nr:hypothetical protein [Candidatus Aminicenantes bacterium]
MIFPDVNPFIGGISGVIGVAMISLLACLTHLTVISKHNLRQSNRIKEA